MDNEQDTGSAEAPSPAPPTQGQPSNDPEPGGWENEPGDLGPLGSTTELRGGREPGSVRFPIERHEATVRPEDVGQGPDRSVEFAEGERGAADD